MHARTHAMTHAYTHKHRLSLIHEECGCYTEEEGQEEQEQEESLVCIGCFANSLDHPNQDFIASRTGGIWIYRG